MSRALLAGGAAVWTCARELAVLLKQRMAAKTDAYPDSFQQSSSPEASDGMNRVWSAECRGERYGAGDSFYVLHGSQCECVAR